MVSCVGVVKLDYIHDVFLREVSLTTRHYVTSQLPSHFHDHSHTITK